MKVLVTGANGQLGRCLQDRIAHFGFDGIFTDLEQLDIAHLDSVEQFIEQCRPDVVINAAAYTAVDKAESEYDIAYAVNAKGPHNLALVTSNLNIPLVHVSTDYVFDGNATTPYLSSSLTSPQSVYGETKFAGEKLVAAANDKHVIVRTAWVFSEYGKNFVKTMLRLGKERDEIKVVADQYGCPTYAGDLANALLLIVRELVKDKPYTKYGTFHHCGDLPTSWHGFTAAIVDEAYTQKILDTKPLVTPIPSSDYPTPAKRPFYSVLDCDDFPVEVERNWRSSLKHVVEKASH
ncbi:dTDP-4-dehydrorhamnose reductase [Photobacterium alginatilyticum]|uniref:dTDP-4-dehydrorhamnose reductase n=1 Tax=Photobacterium alginatilyticum TaxID=1775171 RepID=UPI0040679D6D